MAGYHHKGSKKAQRPKPHKITVTRFWPGTTQEGYRAECAVLDRDGVEIEGVGDTFAQAVDELLAQATVAGHGGERFCINGTFESPTAASDRVEMDDPFDATLGPEPEDIEP